MRKTAFALMFGLVAWVVYSQPVAEPRPLDDDQRFTLLTAPLEVDADQAEETRVRRQRFRALWSDNDYGPGLSTAPDAAVELRVRAAENITFLGAAGWVLARNRAALDEAQRRGIVRSESVRRLFNAYIAAFDFEMAADLAQHYPAFSLPAVPKLVQAGLPPSESSRKLWKVHEDPVRFEAFYLDLSQPHLVVISSPGCAFCRRAVRDLTADSILGPLMKEHVIWVTQISINDTYQRLQQFNNTQSSAEHFFVGDPSKWPVDDFGFFPNFVFMANGEVVENLVGWRGGSESLWAIARGFASAGLLELEGVADEAFDYADVEEAKPEHCPTRDEAWTTLLQSTQIRSREDLDAHLNKIEAGHASPLLALSVEARKRLANSIRFADNRALGFRLDDMRASLDPRQFHDVSKLFGLHLFYAGGFFPVEILSDEDQDLKARFDCTGAYSVSEQ
ncbi:MAG: hypothetical protein ACLFQC_08725 [Wenzhouxiangella sp.]